MIDKDGTAKNHFCPVLSCILPQLTIVRLRLISICESFISAAQSSEKGPSSSFVVAPSLEVLTLRLEAAEKQSLPPSCSKPRSQRRAERGSLFYQIVRSLQASFYARSFPEITRLSVCDLASRYVQYDTLLGTMREKSIIRCQTRLMPVLKLSHGHLQADYLLRYINRKGEVRGVVGKQHRLPHLRLNPFPFPPPLFF